MPDSPDPTTRGSAAQRRWFERLTFFALGATGTFLSMLCTLVAWAAFGWRDAVLVFVAAIGGFFWAFALGELTRRGK